MKSRNQEDEEDYVRAEIRGLQAEIRGLHRALSTPTPSMTTPKEPSRPKEER